ncbi:MAG: MFS transporter [gamma proteobacterium symbiont of Lucinoma myriamae]|nr:MFS transporter [gamma proteobacterium symbiont of Lucinoma myriamae]MCU7817717.1 MFS transporter [gamma proteobacterium symbiont of Lucinoma myriamae]MCU7831003.1 MFS transporter [gamma proteobacterium symbiont of Lucinoma myriamae]
MKENEIDKLNPTEKRAAASLASIYSLRMLGLFMIFPVFSLYGQQLEGNTPLLIGLAIGAYGLTQAIFQIPFGMLSDKIGRKPVIVMGMLIFALGSVVAAMADSIYGVIFGRIIQGSGAVAAAVMALAADLTREEHRLKIMATIGMSIGFAFAVAMVAGSVLNEMIGVDGMFWLTAVFALMGVAVTLFWVPDAPRSFHRETEPVPEQFKSILKDHQLLRLDAGIMILHMVLTATFLVIPIALVNEQHANLASSEHWKIYLPVMILAMGLMIPFIIIAESKRRMKEVFNGAIVVIALSELGFWAFNDSILGLSFFILIFFAAFNVLEASLPSLIAKMSPSEAKGTAMGIYSTSQFFGAFLGGVIGGKILGLYGINGVFLFAMLITLVWSLIALTMKSPRYLSSFVVKLSSVKTEDISHVTAELTRICGVAEAVVIPEDGAAYLKVELHALDKLKLKEFSKRYSEEDE